MDNLVFVHGYLGGAAQWNAQVNFLKQDYRVFCLDLPGYGARSDEVAPDSITAFAEFCLSELTALGCEKFHLVGHSMGGMVVQEMIRLAPERVNRLMLYGTGPVGLLPGRFEPIEESKRRVKEDGAEVSARRISATWFLAREESAQYPVCEALAIKSSMQAMLAGLTAMETWSGVDALPSIKSPTLVLWGDGDRTYPWSQAEHLWHEIEGARLAVIPGCAHAVHLEQTEIFNAILEQFLKVEAQ